MKICFLAGANSIHSYLWVKYFSERGHEIHWISLTPNRFNEIKNVEFYLMREFSAKFLTILLNARTVKKLIKEINPDILHVHYAGVNGILGGLSGFHPFLLTAYGSDIFLNSKSIIKKYLVKFALKKADLITCNGKTLSEEIIKLGANPREIRFIYWATDTKKFIPKSKDKNLGKKLGISGSSVIISVRNLEPVYGVETLIKSLPLVLKEFPKVKLVIAGKGSEEKNLKKLTEESGISDSVKFIGWIPYDDMPIYLNSADVYISTSLSDGDLSQSTQQAMACEIPIVTTDLAVNKARIKDGENGLIFPQRDPKSLAEKITKLLKNKKLRTKLSKNGRKTIETELDYYKNMEKAENLYKEIIEKFSKKNYEKN